ncbi:MAG TPA: hypothetical protein VMW69_09575 [Spirochaetia bacterium]|nr:hypothetical protein [Spirochaetia bacterium]
MRKTLVELVREGKLQSVSDLKRIYHRLLLKTHPDAIGSDIRVGSYLEILRQYEEAVSYLAQTDRAGVLERNPIEANHRLEFFRQWDIIESLEPPYAFLRKEHRVPLEAAKRTAQSELAAWKPEWKVLYRAADAESVRMKQGIPLGPYAKHAVGLNVRPLVHNIVYFHLTGRAIYERQARQNFAAIMYRLDAEGFPALREFLTRLAEDMETGSAVMQ